MAFQRGIDGPEPVRPDPVGHLSGTQEERRVARSSYLATGTLACPDCDAPVPLHVPVRPVTLLICPYCLRSGHAREFLSLAAPSRPARVQVTVVPR
jgi:hypothetical protein